MGSENGEQSWIRYKLEEIENPRVENLVSGGTLVIDHAEVPVVLLRFSGAKAKLFGRRVEVIKKAKAGEEPTEQELADPREEAICPTCGRPYGDPDRRFCPRCTNKRSLFRRTLSYAKPYRRRLAGMVVLLAITVGLRMVSPILTGSVLFDDVLAPDGRFYGAIGALMLIIAAVEIGVAVATILYNRSNSWFAAQIIFDLKTQVYDRLQHLSLGFFTRKQTGGLMTRVNGDTTEMQFFFHDGLPSIVIQSAMLLGVLIVMLLVNWQLTLLAVVPAPLLLLLIRKTFPRLWVLFSRRHQSRRRFNGLLNDVLSGAREVKSFGKEQDEIRRFTPANAAVTAGFVNARVYSATVFPLIFAVVSVGGYLIWGFGGIQVVGGTFSLGMLLSFTRYLWMVYQPLAFMTHMVEWWSYSMNAAQRVFEIIDAEPEVRECEDPVPLRPIRGRIEMEGVTFGYEPNRPVLHEISLTVGEGETIGLVGHTGAGKSTITNLITRLYDPEKGRVKIDGMDLREVAAADLRSQIGIVLQETVLFTGTVAENIAYAKPDATREEIVHAATAAEAHGFIAELPDGYDTIVGYHGHDFSGGERQRLAIARAILHDPRILIFDEATSSMDTETESRIQHAIGHLVGGRTTIAIAHRLSTLRHADRLYVVESGKIVESGTHGELMKERGAYYRLVRKQREALRHIGVKE